VSCGAVTAGRLFHLALLPASAAGRRLWPPGWGETASLLAARAAVLRLVMALWPVRPGLLHASCPPGAGPLDAREGGLTLVWG
jgi:hypothetical protein